MSNMLAGVAALCLAGSLPSARAWGSWGGSSNPPTTSTPPTTSWTRYGPTSTPPPSPPPPSPKWTGYGVPSPEPKEECETIVHSHTEEWLSKATKNAASLMVDLHKYYCSGVADPLTMVEYFDARVGAMAELVLYSRITCDANGTETLTCGNTWVGAQATAQAMWDEYYSIWASTGTKDDCNCGVELFADADATVASWGSIWVDIYAQLDDTACAGGTSGDVYVDDIDRVTVKNCTGTVVASYWGKLMASVWLEGECTNTDAAECATCCVDESGATIDGCDCAAWREECNKAVSVRTQATAQAWLGAQVEEQTSGCTTTTWEIINGVKQEVEVTQGEVDEDNSGADITAPADVTCEAYAAATAEAAAVSDQASAVASMIEETCNLDLRTQPYEDLDTALASALARIYNEAFSKCTLQNGEHADAYGCAVSVSFSSSYAGACAQATADAIAKFNSMKDVCGCDLTMYAQAGAWAGVYEQLFAHAESKVAAQACSDEYAGTATEAEIRRTCLVHSVAAASAKAVARIMVDNGCPAGDNAWCDDECKRVGYSADGDGWLACLEGCHKEADAAATAFAEALATIDIDTNYNCTADQDVVGSAFVVEDKLLGTPGDSP